MHNTIPKQMYSLKNNIIYVIVITLWVLVFAVVYTPTFGRTTEELAIWNEHYSFCICIICAISTVTASICRLVFCLTSHNKQRTPLEYWIYQILELVIICLFCDLFLCLFFHRGYFDLLPMVLLIGLLIYIAPFLFWWFYITSKEKEQVIIEAYKTINDLKKGIGQNSESSAIKFIDENGNIKLVVSPDHVVSIESAGNYVTIVYQNNGRLSKFALRNTLKAIEEVCDRNGLVRCHRSWLVNLRKIRLLRKDTTGVFAEIDVDGINDIPVSKNYISTVAQRLSNI